MGERRREGSVPGGVVADGPRDTATLDRNPAWQMMAQVSLGEFLASPDRDAFFAVNFKRVDFDLMDQNARVVHALE